MPVDAEIGNYRCQAASHTLIVGIFVGNGPVALVAVHALAALPVGLFRVGGVGRFPKAIALGLERAHFPDFREEGQRMAALHALRIFEKNRLAAVAAVKDLHLASLPVLGLRATGDCGGKMEPTVRFELTTVRLQGECSTN